MNRCTMLFFVFGLQGLSCVLAAMQPSINPPQARIQQDQRSPLPNSYALKRFCSSIGSVGNYLPSYQTVRTKLSAVIPSSSAVIGGLIGGAIQTMPAVGSNRRTVPNLKEWRFTPYKFALAAKAALSGGKYIFDHRTGRRYYDSHEPEELIAIKNKHAQFDQLASDCEACIDELTKQMDQAVDANAKRQADRFIAQLKRLARFIYRCTGCIVDHKLLNARDDIQLMPLDAWPFDDKAISAFEIALDRSADLISQCKPENEHHSRDEKIKHCLNDTVLKDFKEFIDSCEQGEDGIYKYVSRERGYNSADNHSQAKRFETKWSTVNGAMAAAKCIGSSILFSKSLALAGSLSSLQNAGSFLAAASAKPGFCGLATFFGVNCATAFGSMATAYALEKVIIKPLLKPLLIRLFCKLRGIPYNPGRSNRQPSPAAAH